MNENMNFDCTIRRRTDGEFVTFSFKAEHVVSPSNLYIGEPSGEGKKIHVINYLYGKIVIGNDSYFSEVIGYVDPEMKRFLTYHIVFIDLSFDNKYEIIDDYSEFSIKENYEFL